MSKTTDAMIDNMYGAAAWQINQIKQIDEMWEMTQKCMAPSSLLTGS